MSGDLFDCHKWQRGERKESATDICAWRPGKLPNIYNAQDSPTTKDCPASDICSAEGEKPSSRERKHSLFLVSLLVTLKFAINTKSEKHNLSLIIFLFG